MPVWSASQLTIYDRCGEDFGVINQRESPSAAGDSVHDPYKPPKATLDIPRERVKAPRQVRNAAVFLGTSAILILVVLAAMWLGLISMPGPAEAKVPTTLI